MHAYEQEAAMTATADAYSKLADQQATEIQRLVEEIQGSLATLEQRMNEHLEAVADLETRVSVILAPTAPEPAPEEKEGSRPEPVIETELGQALYALRNRILNLSNVERRRALDAQDVSARVRL